MSQISHPLNHLWCLHLLDRQSGPQYRELNFACYHFPQNTPRVNVKAQRSSWKGSVIKSLGTTLDNDVSSTFVEVFEEFAGIIHEMYSWKTRAHIGSSKMFQTVHLLIDSFCYLHISPWTVRVRIPNPSIVVAMFVNMFITYWNPDMCTIIQRYHDTHEEGVVNLDSDSHS